MNSKRLILFAIILLCLVATISYAGPAVKKTTKPTKAQVTGKSLPQTSLPIDPIIAVPPAPVVLPPVVASLPAGTLVLLSLNEDLCSGTQKVGDTVSYVVDANIYDAAGHLVIAQGAMAAGTISQSSKNGTFGKPGKLKFSCDSVPGIDGKPIAFADPLFNNSAKGSQLALLLFTPFVLMPFEKGVNIQLNSGMPITMATSADAKITLPDAPNPETNSSANPVGQTVTVLQAGRHKKPFNATVKSYTTNEVVFTTDEGDKNIKLKDITKLMPTEPETAVATTNEH